MTRDQWLKRCASRFASHGDMDADSAAAYADECARDQGGRSPRDWRVPEEVADEEIRLSGGE